VIDPRWRVEADLPTSTRSVPIARWLLDQLLIVWNQTALAEDARIVLSELLTNAIRHAPSSRCLHLYIQSHGDRLYLAIDDNSPDPPVLRPDAQQALDGRGLRIVDYLATHWGVQPDHHGGKRVWAELPAPAT
jgi:serine/threonine-protein kinase RsbW